jgi:hypothetical protein
MLVAWSLGWRVVRGVQRPANSPKQPRGHLGEVARKQGPFPGRDWVMISQIMTQSPPAPPGGVVTTGGMSVQAAVSSRRRPHGCEWTSD